ncbi:flotillin family protein [Lewinella sp. W8]|uniref:flotillin family protein n=1 Tax=Lewinella sp. W8 TaxID=2528208 RepID=UPI0010678788|nr:flotillin family protein [Lewinella sp. W8]MTB50124.1 flotillin family protein [Lewinella sp. W8]
MELLLPIGLVVFVFFLVFLFFVSRYKRCPSDKILVVYGKTGGEASAKCYAGGAAFVWPVIQDYKYLDLTPLSIDVNLQDALSKQNIRVSVPAQFTVGISNKPHLMLAAAERLLALDRQSITNLSHDIIMGQMRLVIANMDIEELNTDRDKFVDSVYSNVGDELHKIGLELINVNVTDIQDESGYIKALGQEAAAKAINDAKIKVANEVRTGSIGEAEARQDQRTKVADAESRASIGEAVAEAKATEGKNTSAIKIANSNAARDIELAEANRRAEAARKVAAAQAREEAYKAEQSAEVARALAEKARMEAEEVVAADIDRQKAVIAAQAEAEKRREIARGEADAVLARYRAEADGMAELLNKQAEGFDKLVRAANGDAQSAIGFLMIEKLTELAKIQTDAIKDVEIDKVVVYDNGNGQGVGNFVQGLYGMVPQLNDFLNQSGMSLPQALVQQKIEKPAASQNGHAPEPEAPEQTTIE